MKPTQARPAVKLGLILVALVAALAVTPSATQATPAYARQTGVSCQACHTVFPELTPFGRKFKLNAYVFTNVKQLAPVSEQAQRTLALSEIPPVAIQLQGSNTMLARALPDSGLTKELRKRKYYEKPCEARRRAELRKQSNMRKAQNQTYTTNGRH